MVVIYQGDKGTVSSGLFTGIRFVLPTGRTVKPSPLAKKLMPALAAALKAHGKNIQTTPVVAEAFWNFFLELAASPAGGLFECAIASMTLDQILREEFSIGAVGLMPSIAPSVAWQPMLFTGPYQLEWSSRPLMYRASLNGAPWHFSGQQLGLMIFEVLSDHVALICARDRLNAEKVGAAVRMMVARDLVGDGADLLLERYARMSPSVIAENYVCAAIDRKTENDS